ncbi:hypothetical protein ALO41_200235 [Pseudomonas amygdali pv. ulmi]|uniref:Uncharacterized protein n=1 Tax=Pseudomonas amygdali pv. ulmi TaxID=251720 RepID=A0A0Q0DE48_PSEA0|nr:hypothetical protein ALO41_200235 [Pseudomonas amygdali pv. ulmi]
MLFTVYCASVNVDFAHEDKQNTPDPEAAKPLSHLSAWHSWLRRAPSVLHGAAVSRCGPLPRLIGLRPLPQ